MTITSRLDTSFAKDNGALQRMLAGLTPTDAEAVALELELRSEEAWVDLAMRVPWARHLLGAAPRLHLQQLKTILHRLVMTRAPSMANQVKHRCELSPLEIKFMWAVIAGARSPHMKLVLPPGTEGISIGFFIEHMESAAGFGAATRAANVLLASPLLRHHLIVPTLIERAHTSYDVHTTFSPATALLALWEDSLLAGPDVTFDFADDETVLSEPRQQALKEIESPRDRLMIIQGEALSGRVRAACRAFRKPAMICNAAQLPNHDTNSALLIARLRDWHATALLRNLLMVIRNIDALNPLQLQLTMNFIAGRDAQTFVLLPPTASVDSIALYSGRLPHIVQWPLDDTSRVLRTHRFQDQLITLGVTGLARRETDYMFEYDVHDKIALDALRLRIRQFARPAPNETNPMRDDRRYYARPGGFGPLVTVITGPAGTGKTRCAIDLASREMLKPFVVHHSILQQPADVIALLFEQADAASWCLIFDDADELLAQYDHLATKAFFERLMRLRGVAIFTLQQPSPHIRRFATHLVMAPLTEAQRIELWRRVLFTHDVELTHDIDPTTLAQRFPGLPPASILRILDDVAAHAAYHKTAITPGAIGFAIKNEHRRIGISLPTAALPWQN